MIRIDPTTGAGMPDNPLADDPDPNARRIIAYGLRNPFRITTRPGSSEIWVGDVGYNTWEEINRINSPQTIQNFGWPCYEGIGQQSSYANLPVNICTNLYNQPGAVTPPVFTYNHSAKIVPGETCTTGSSSVTGLAFYTGTSYPGRVSERALLRRLLASVHLDDVSRRQRQPGSHERSELRERRREPRPARHRARVAISSTSTSTATRSIAFSTSFRTAVIAATPDDGSAPADRQLRRLRIDRSRPDRNALLLLGLNGDGTFGDATTAQTSYTFARPGVYTVTLRVTDTHGGTDTEQAYDRGRQLAAGRNDRLLRRRR